MTGAAGDTGVLPTPCYTRDMTQLADRQPGRRTLLEGGPHRFTLDEFYRMGNAGVFDDRRVELLEGEVYTLPPQGFRHADIIRGLTEEMIVHFRDRAFTSPQCPVIINAELDSYLEPDVALLRLPKSQYRERHVVAADVLLAVEVSATTLAKDRGPKLAIYAGAGVPEVWIVNLGGEKLEVYRQPSSEGYRSITILDAGQPVGPLEFPESPLRWW